MRFSFFIFSFALVGLLWASLSGCYHQPTEPIDFQLHRDVEEGKQLITAYGCLECHYIEGARSAANWQAPPLTAWKRRSYIAGEHLNNVSNLIRWIMAPDSMAPDTAMPNLKVRETEARKMAAYLNTLK